MSRAPFLAPIAAGAGVLAVTLAGVLIVRGDTGDDPPPDAPRFATVFVIADPIGARVSHDGALAGEAPLSIELRPGARTTITVEQPVFLPQQFAVAVGPGGDVVRATLVPDARADGDWRGPDGAIVSLARAADGIDAVEAGVHRHLAWVARPLGSDDPTISFAALVPALDPRIPDEPSCRTEVRVEYRYDPARDELARTVERAAFELHGRRCAIVSRAAGAPVRLTRAPKSTTM